MFLPAVSRPGQCLLSLPSILLRGWSAHGLLYLGEGVCYHVLLLMHCRYCSVLCTLQVSWCIIQAAGTVLCWGGALVQRTGGSEVAICSLNLVHISPHLPIYSVGLVFLVTGVTHQDPLWRGATFWDIGLLQTLRIGVYSDPRV